MRLSGVLDFPLFAPGPPFGYIPQPNQNGRFLNRNDWVFNEISMGTARPFTPAPQKHDEVLLGDSIVSGGNPYRQADRLGVRLEEAADHIVWPISANSWGLSNELTYLEHHPEVVAGADSFTFVLNSKDLGPASVWASEQTHPTHRPASALAYVLSKTFIHHKTPDEPTAITWPRQWASFTANAHRPIRVVLYPTKAEAADQVLRRQQLTDPLMKALSRPNVQFLDVGADGGWNAMLYRDDIHPTPDGTRRLAKILSSRSPSLKNSNFERQ